MFRKALHNLINDVQYSIQPQGVSRQGGMALGIVHFSCGSSAMKGMMLEISLIEYWHNGEELCTTQTLAPNCNVPANTDMSWPYAIQIPKNARLTIEPNNDFQNMSRQGWYLKVRLQRPILDIVIEEQLKMEVSAEIDALIQICKGHFGMKMVKEPKWDKGTRMIYFKMSPPNGMGRELTGVEFKLRTTEQGLEGSITLSHTNKKLTDFMKTAVGMRNRAEQPFSMRTADLLLEDGNVNLEGGIAKLTFDNVHKLASGQVDGKLSLAEDQQELPPGDGT